MAEPPRLDPGRRRAPSRGCPSTSPTPPGRGLDDLEGRVGGERRPRDAGERQAQREERQSIPRPGAVVRSELSMGALLGRRAAPENRAGKRSSRPSTEHALEGQGALRPRIVQPCRRRRERNRLALGSTTTNVPAQARSETRAGRSQCGRYELRSAGHPRAPRRGLPARRAPRAPPGAPPPPHDRGEDAPPPPAGAAVEVVLRDRARKRSRSGVAAALRPDDWILPMHRNLGVFTGRGLDLRRSSASSSDATAGSPRAATARSTSGCSRTGSWA